MRVVEMMSKKVVATVCAGMLTLGMALPAMAGIIYVDINNTSGNEDGSLEFPYDSISQAITVSVNGDTIKVAPGVYLGDLDINSKTLKLEGEDPATTTIQGIDRTVEVTGAFSSGGSDPVEITGFTITGGATAGIYLNSSTLNAIIRNNIISGNKSGIYKTSTGNITISNNTITLNTYYGVELRSGGSVSVTNNIVVNNVDIGIYEADTTVLAANNNVWANTVGNYGNYRGTLTIIDNISLDPQIVTGSFYLSAGSPCIDAGRTLLADNDPDGTRNDIGVYGGPGAANFWPEPAGGAVVTSMSVFPPSVPVGGTITLQATGKIR